MILKTVVFDMDDTMYDLNGFICNKIGVDINNLTDFNVCRCNLLTEEQRNKLVSEYSNVENFDRPFYNGVEVLPCLEDFGYRAVVCSNCLSEAIRKFKYERLRKLGIPDSAIFLHIIGENGIDSKKLPDDIDVFVEDSPYNVAGSDARINFMVKRPWNQSDYGKQLVKGKNIKYISTFDEAIAFLTRKE